MRELLACMAASRFGAEAAERLSTVLAGVAFNPERLYEVGEWLVYCETVDEFLARVNSVRTDG